MNRNINEVKRQIAEAEGFPIEKIDEFVAFIGEEPYITGAGLQWKMLEKYGAGKFAIQAMIPSPEEYALLRRMMGLKEEEPMVVMRGEVWIEGFDRPFVDYGTTTPGNLSGFVKFSQYPLEMATRRATNRAMRLATATGMCSVDEVKSAGAPAQAGGDGQQEDRGNRHATQARDKGGPEQEQINLIQNLGRSMLLSEEERKQTQAFLSDNPTRKRASAMIERLKTILEARRSSGKQNEGADGDPPPPSGEPAPGDTTFHDPDNPVRDGQTAA